jgi:chorismate mutase/prephenate dehydratase
VAESTREVEALRQRMAEIDAQLLSLLDKRAKAARDISQLRKDQPAALPSTDHATIRELVALSNGDMPRQPLQDIFRSIYAACLALELPVKVTFVGLEGGPGHAAARGRFGHTSSLQAAETALMAVEDVARKNAEFAVVPFENEAESPVPSTIAALVTSELRIVEVLDVPIDLQVLNRSGNFGDVQRLRVAPADRLLCRRFLEGLAPMPEILEVRTPLLACQMALEDGGVGAIARQDIGEPIGLRVARSTVLDNGPSHERCAVVGTRPSGRTEKDVTLFVFGVDASPGSLLRVLKVFTDRSMDIKRIQSHPTKGEGYDCLFCAETAGHFTDRSIVMAFEEIRRLTRFFKLLGSYPG